MIRSHLTQENNFGCGLYSVANALNIPNFITDERLEASKSGNNNGQLSKWLQEDGFDISIDSFYYNHNLGKLPEDHSYYHPDKEGNFLPVLINVKLSENGLRHMVAGVIDHQGNMYLMDSLKKKVVETRLCHMNDTYYHVFGLFIFMKNSDGNYVTLIKN